MHGPLTERYRLTVAGIESKYPATTLNLRPAKNIEFIHRHFKYTRGPRQDIGAALHGKLSEPASSIAIVADSVKIL